MTPRWIGLDAQRGNGRGQQFVVADEHHQLDAVTLGEVVAQRGPRLIADVVGVDELVDCGEYRALPYRPSGGLGAGLDTGEVVVSQRNRTCARARRAG